MLSPRRNKHRRAGFDPYQRVTLAGQLVIAQKPSEIVR